MYMCIHIYVGVENCMYRQSEAGGLVHAVFDKLSDIKGREVCVCVCMCGCVGVCLCVSVLFVRVCILA